MPNGDLPQPRQLPLEVGARGGLPLLVTVGGVEEPFAAGKGVENRRAAGGEVRAAAGLSAAP